jgi:photosystem II stability/assembly factor-like uncharacterized protein
MQSNFTDSKPIGSMTMSGYVQSAAAVSSSRAFLATDRGSLLETTDGGRSWIGVRDFHYGESFFTGFVFVDDRHGWVGARVPATNYEDRIYRTKDGGTTWTYSRAP